MIRTQDLHNEMNNCPLFQTYENYSFVIHYISSESNYIIPRVYSSLWHSCKPSTIHFTIIIGCVAIIEIYTNAV
jgi:hypothetical protein